MLGDRLKSIRKEKKLTQKAFAEALNTSPGYISEIEKGKKVPGGELLTMLKRVFDVDINWLLLGEIQKSDSRSQVATGNGIVQIGGSGKGSVRFGRGTILGNNISRDRQKESGMVSIGEVKNVLEDYVAPKIANEIIDKLSN
ncbi:helix-turn-helix transcriptional regulator [Desulfuromonas acetoxidans]|uniref:helix-turn-helix domain-containing protein n=1 Tax=Desulfuromonas acetoxidans TaxID=891 RepID=UPI00292E365B|nr:helix-turn-helix transcriptional regulator [Desulfuromonas acetoxidans]